MGLIYERGPNRRSGYLILLITTGSQLFKYFKIRQLLVPVKIRIKELLLGFMKETAIFWVVI
jgi:hypothetical protein